MTKIQTDVYSDLVDNFVEALAIELKEPVSNFLVLDALASCGLMLTYTKDENVEQQFALKERLTQEFYSLGILDEDVFIEPEELGVKKDWTLYNAVESALFLGNGEGQLYLSDFPVNVSSIQMYEDIKKGA